MSRFYRLHDWDPERKRLGAIATPAGELERWNRDGWGVFHTVQVFKGPRRIANLDHIVSWATEIDGDKVEAADRLSASPLIPSRVIESKNGYHVYWDAKPGAEARHYRAITTALAQHFGGDMNARDLARILRTPGFLHQKDPADPFRIVERHRWQVRYRQDEIAAAFGVELLDEAETVPAKPAPPHRPVVFDEGDSFWRKAISLDCRDALQRLSGHWLVGGEDIELKPQRNGRFNIWCEGKSTSCWVDAEGRIGSADGGGPSIVRWCHWYGHSWADIARGLKELWPELDDRSERRRAA